MNTPPTDRPTSTSPRTMGATDATDHNAAHDDEHNILRPQDSHELQLTPSTENSVTGFDADDNESNRVRLHSTAISLSSLRSSPSASSVKSSISSRSANVPLEHLAENFAHMNIDTNMSVMPPDILSLQRRRMRELSAPLPSAPPSTPATAVTHRVSLSQPRNFIPVSLSGSLLQTSTASPSLYGSPMTEQRSDSDYTEHEEASDSASIEIISASLDDSFITGRFETRDGITVTRGLFATSRDSSPRPFGLGDESVSPARPHVARTTTTATVTAASHAPTPHPSANQAPSPVFTVAGEVNSTGTASDSAPPSSPSFNSLSKSPSPSRAHPRRIAQVDVQCYSKASSPVRSGAPNPIARQDSQRTGHQVESGPEADAGLRTPNVYINGLPPHFPDESLFLMTREFGHVLSVRTFTRCVGEKMSGYGFVLFDSVDAAARCIESLRKYRNIHPSFSKQVHKIPGTPYSSGAITIPPAGSLSSLPSLASLPSLSSTLNSSSAASSLMNISSPDSFTWAGGKVSGHQATESISGISSTSGSEFGSRDSRDTTFREKMERLKDERSTNLYMEGLPLTIDDVSLAALVSPHRIISSRFFQTKLSNPPRMISFVRLETRQGAEEVVERLHGRVVRGWNDNGCRISVRFADSAEQRELRRAERLARGEEEDVGGTGRLSMAQAALLNLRGAEAQAQGVPLVQVQSPFFEPPHSPQSLKRVKLTNFSGSVENHGIESAFHPMTVSSAHDFVNMGAASKVNLDGRYHNQQQQAPVLALDHKLRSRDTYERPAGTGSADGFGRSALPSAAYAFSDAPTLSKRVALAGMLPSNKGDISLSLPAQSMGQNQLALMRQQAQLQQLQLLQQMQHANMQEINSNYYLRARPQVQPNPLMPPVDIRTTQLNDTHAREPHAPLQQIRSYNNTTVASGISNFIPANNIERLYEQQAANAEYLSQLHDQQQDLHQDVESQHHRHQRKHNPSSGYMSTHVFRSRADSMEQLGIAHSRRAGTDDREDHGRIDDNDAAMVSPALTYASRTPSTLSPATPLFNNFGTPASAPATVPTGKSTIREREFHRTFKNSFHQ